MQVLIKFGDFGQHTIVVPITTLGIVNGELVRGFGYTSKRLYLWAEAKERADSAILELNILLRRPDDVPILNVNVF